MIKTFRGKLEDSEQEKIRLSTKNGKIGYQFKKLVIIGNTPGDATSEGVVKFFKVEQSTVDALVDFSDHNLLAVGYWEDGSTAGYTGTLNIMFEKEIFNQDIYVTLKNTEGSVAMNYYIELEAMPLTDNAAAVSTLRDIRLNPQVGA